WSGVLPRTGTDARHRVCAAARRPQSHSHNLPRPNQRLRRETCQTMNWWGRFTSFAVLGAWLASPAAAHRVDEYLQATRLSIDTERVDLEIDLTAGSAMASQVFGWIDTNRNGEISDAEGQVYAQQVLDSVVLKVDGRPVPIKMVESSFP